ncbi:MAG: carboxypeptidase-like regulatory domain-containing protein, partial [Fidelibacterota bacterium]
MMLQSKREPQVRVLAPSLDLKPLLSPWTWLLAFLLAWVPSLGQAQVETSREYPPSGAAQDVTRRSGLIAGFVLNQETGEGLPGANVYLEGTNIGAATNIDGYFVLTGIPAGT